MECLGDGPGSSAVSTATVRYAATASESFKGPTMVRIRPILSTAFLPNFCRSPPLLRRKKNSKEHRRYKCYKYNNIVCISLKTENLILPVSQKKIILSKFRLPKEYMLS